MEVLAAPDHFQDFCHTHTSNLLSFEDIRSVVWSGSRPVLCRRVSKRLDRASHREWAVLKKTKLDFVLFLLSLFYLPQSGLIFPFWLLGYDDRSLVSAGRAMMTGCVLVGLLSSPSECWQGQRSCGRGYGHYG